MKLGSRLKSQKGQSAIEFIIFAPFFIMLYVMIIDIANAINASINQQKTARGYFYARTKWNSTLPKARYNSGYYDNFNLVIFDFVGWKERFSDGGSFPQAPCFRLRLPMAASTEEECGNYRTPTTQWIRVMTVYGVCGGTYNKIPTEAGAMMVNIYHQVVSGDQSTALAACRNN